MDDTNFFEKHRNSKFIFPKIPDKLTTIAKQANWILIESKIPYLPLDIAGPWKEMYNEALQLDSEFVTHRSDAMGWSSLTIHGLSATKTMSPDAYPEYADIPEKELNYTWTEIQDRCPVTVSYFRDIFGWPSYGRIRFMKLEPGGYIPPHTDGQSHALVAVNISLNNPENCEMIVEDVGVIPFKDSGGALAFNNCRKHSVKNASDISRYHIIVHGTWGSTYSELVVRSYKKLLELQ